MSPPQCSRYLLRNLA